MGISAISGSSQASAAEAKSIQQQIAACEQAIAAAKDPKTKQTKEAELAKLQSELHATPAATAAPADPTGAGDSDGAAARRKKGLVDVLA